jgi:hypothetical protein
MGGWGGLRYACESGISNRFRGWELGRLGSVRCGCERGISERQRGNGAGLNGCESRIFRGQRDGGFVRGF